MGTNNGLVRAGTRKSRLALIQTHLVLDRLSEAWPALQLVTKPYVTRGDRSPEAVHTLSGGKGIFTSTLEDALRAHEIDIAVHSLKDLPVTSAPDLLLGAILDRSNACDVLIAHKPWTIHTLPEHSSVGTGSLRRAAQLLHQRRDLVITPIRGNIDTRIQKMNSGHVDAVILAAAGLMRLNMTSAISSYLPLHVVLPAPGQGALAVQCRTDDTRIRTLLAPLDDAALRATTTAERVFLEVLQGGCTAPVATYARHNTDGEIIMDARIATSDGQHMIHLCHSGKNPRVLGTMMAERALQQGATTMLHHA